ncbi:zincin [Exidia glandulosa HHB12029]|uniref:Zincin n=1 Tax=Exidia glandulosa HHB12029 TaxID=1314781 RepID=A0A165EBN7_EXIGL|nr:zincin [Exidia glandulosa HHB12029]
MSGRPHSPPDDEESPLLGQNGRHGDDDEQPTLYDRAIALTQEPLTDLARVLLVACVVLLLLAATFIGLFAGAEHKLHKIPPQRDPVTTTTTQTATVTTTVHSEPTPSACFTPDCIQLSSDILSSLDTSKDPCEDFYDFATGGWQRAHPLASDKSRWGSFLDLAKENKAIIQRIVNTDDGDDEDSLSDADKESLGKIRTLYASCVDEDTAAELGEEPLAKLVNTLRDIFHGKDVGAMSSLPPQEDAVQASFSAGKAGKHPLTAALAYVHSRGVSALFDIEIEGDAGRDPDEMVPIFSQPGLGLPSKEYYVGDELKDVYTSTLESLLLALAPADETKLVEDQSKPMRKAHFWPPWPWPPWGDDDDTTENKTARAHRLAKAVYKFESSLAEASGDLDIILQDPKATYNPVPLSTLAYAVPQVNFPAYFASFAVRRFPGSTVILSYPPFVAALGDMLHNTSTEILEAYLVSRVALHYAPYLAHETDAWKAWRTLDESVRGLKKGAAFAERGEWCLEQVERQLGYSVGRFFVQEKFAGDSRDKGVKVIKDITAAFKESLTHLEWMDEESAAAAAQKADSLDVKVGYPMWPDTTSDRAIAAYYVSLKLDNATFFENIVNSIILDEKSTWMQLGQRRDHRRWEMFASTVNAYYQPPANEIVFPAGIMQPPFFSAKWPGYLNYGAFGQVAAHELTHAFDNAGRLFNQNGKLEEWWTNATSDAFNERAACLSAQYSKYTIDDGKGHKVHVNGNLTSGENIGDSGIVQAFRAWHAQFDDSFAAGNEYILPGLNYTREQLFFIAFGRIWASITRPATALQLVRVDPHSPNRFRVEGTLYNTPEFAKAFNCKPGSKLAPPPEKQCRIW